MSIGVKTLSWAITRLTNNTERLNACFGRTCTFQWMWLSYVLRGVPSRMRCHFRALFVASSPVRESVGIGNRNVIWACSAVFGSTRARVRLSCFVIQQVSETWEEGGGGGSSVGAQRRARAYRRTLNLVATLIKAARRTVWTLACVIVLYFLRAFRCRCR